MRKKFENFENFEDCEESRFSIKRPLEHRVQNQMTESVEKSFEQIFFGYTCRTRYEFNVVALFRTQNKLYFLFGRLSYVIKIIYLLVGEIFFRNFYFVLKKVCIEIPY